MLIYKRWRSNITYVRRLRGADRYRSISGGYKFRVRLAISKQVTQNSDGDRFNLGKLNELEVKKQSQIEIKNRFAAFGNLSDNEDINRAWENIKGNIETSTKGSLVLHEFKQHKPCFEDECLQFLDEGRPAKMQWVQDQSQSNVDNLNSIRSEASKHFRNIQKEHLKLKIEELENKI